jgi:hypothetical protein
MCTIPPRQQLSSPTRLVLRRRDVIYGSRTLALINPKACTTAHTRKREKRAFLTFFEKTLPSSQNSSLTFPRTHAHTHNLRSIDRFIKTQEHAVASRKRERVVAKKRVVFLESVLNHASEQNRQDTRFGTTFRARVSNSFKFVHFPENFTSLLMHEICAKLTFFSLLLSLSFVNSTVNSTRG